MLFRSEEVKYGDEIYLNVHGKMSIPRIHISNLFNLTKANEYVEIDILKMSTAKN